MPLNIVKEAVENIIEKEESVLDKELIKELIEEGTPNINSVNESDYEDGYAQAFSDIDKFLEENLFIKKEVKRYKFFDFEWDDFKKEKLGELDNGI